MTSAWRTVLFTPGDRPERVEKAWRSGAADVVVADLEDAILPDAKGEARITIRDLLGQVEAASCRRAVRINAPGTAWHDKDLEMVVNARPDVVVIPKAEQADLVEAAVTPLREADVAVMLIIESARGVLAAQELALIPGVKALAFGAEDLAADVGMERSSDNHEVAVPRSMVALAAAAGHAAAIDMITADYQDLERTGREAREARALGYAGKMVLHPAQVDPVHEAFQAEPDQLAWARKVVDAAKQEAGVFVVDGKMIDRPLVRQAERILARSGPE